MRKKILYITSLFRKRSCSASIRNMALVNGLAELGNDVTVLTIRYPSKVLDDFLVANLDPKIKLIECDVKLISDFVPSSYTGGSSGVVNSQNIFKKYIKKLFFFPSVDILWLKSKHSIDPGSFDYVISSSDTKSSHFLAEKLIKSCSVKWAQIWGDPWQSDVNTNGIIDGLRASYYEKRFLEQADKIFYVSLPTLELMRNIYPSIKSKAFYIPRSYLRSVTSPSFKSKLTINIVYTGVLKGRSITPLLDSISSFNQTSSALKYRLKIFGKLSEAQLSTLESCDFASYFGEVQLSEVFRAYREADVLLYIGNKSGTTQIPGKLYDYFGTDKPILALVEDEKDRVYQFLKESNRCQIFANHKGSIDLNEVSNCLGSKLVLEEYSPSAISKDFLHLLEVN
ncbi:hypothetical protein [Agarivorans aestuarii]|uniref:hypothetical protein n=1 Tax=Agarivorans aestuarii TaxID=1563703 RepID=UPI001C819A01|nr:hypothetical protein [Agarivorans aestuarii]